MDYFQCMNAAELLYNRGLIVLKDYENLRFVKEKKKRIYKAMKENKVNLN